MLCTHCNKNEAVFHYQQINGGTYTETHLCSDCAKKLGYIGGFDSPISIGNMLSQFWGNSLSDIRSHLACDVCGTTYDEFRKTGLLGCDHCYDIFEDVANSMLSDIQSSNTHTGKKVGPSDIKKEKSTQGDSLSALKMQLKKAIQEERYEDAAVIRDKIKKSENGEDKSNG